MAFCANASAALASSAAPSSPAPGVDPRSGPPIGKGESAPARRIGQRRAKAQAPVPALPKRAIGEISVGDKLDGVVRKLVNHGAWVDVGLSQKGLLHVRDMSTDFVFHPSQMLSVGDSVSVFVKYVDIDSQKFSLSLLERASQGRWALSDIPQNQELEGSVVRVTNFGAYIDVGAAVDAFLHISEVWGRRPRETLDSMRLGQKVMVTVVDVDEGRSRVKLAARSVNKARYEEQQAAWHGFDQDGLKETAEQALARPAPAGDESIAE